MELGGKNGSWLEDDREGVRGNVKMDVLLEMGFLGGIVVRLANDEGEEHA